MLTYHQAACRYQNCPSSVSVVHSLVLTSQLRLYRRSRKIYFLGIWHCTDPYTSTFENRPSSELFSPNSHRDFQIRVCCNESQYSSKIIQTYNRDGSSAIHLFETFKWKLCPTTIPNRRHHLFTSESERSPVSSAFVSPPDSSSRPPITSASLQHENMNQQQIF